VQVDGFASFGVSDAGCDPIRVGDGSIALPEVQAQILQFSVGKD
jgi:hypothetical protein